MHVDQRGEGLGSDETKMPAWIPCFICTRPRMAPKLWRESYSAKGMHALIDYHRYDILPSNVERLCVFYRFRAVHEESINFCMIRSIS